MRGNAHAQHSQKKLEEKSKAEVAAAKKKADEACASAKKDLSDAQKKSEEILKAAQKKADDILAAAKKQADDILSAAKKESADTVAKAEKPAKATMAKAEQEAKEVTAGASCSPPPESLNVYFLMPTFISIFGQCGARQSLESSPGNDELHELAFTRYTHLYVYIITCIQSPSCLCTK